MTRERERKSSKETDGYNGRDVGLRMTKRVEWRGEGETVKKTGNLEKETRHAVEYEKQQGVRYLNKKGGSTRASTSGG